MKNLLPTFITSLFTLGIIFNSCAQNRKETKAFRLPEIPSVLVVPQERAAYLAIHYWDHFDFTDTALIDMPEITEQAFADFLGILPYTDRAQEAVDTLFRRAAAEKEMLYHSFRFPTNTSTSPIRRCATKICTSSCCEPSSPSPRWTIRIKSGPVTC